MVRIQGIEFFVPRNIDRNCFLSQNSTVVAESLQSCRQFLESVYSEDS